MIERARQRERPMARDQAVGRLETDDAAIGGRTNGRTVGLATDRERHHVGAHRGSRTARRTAGSMLGIVRIARLAGKKVSELGRDRFADNHRAGRAQPCHDCRVARRRASGINRRAAFGRHVRGIENIFDRDRHAVQRTDRLTAQTERVGRARLRERVLGIKKRPRFNLRIDLANPR